MKRANNIKKRSEQYGSEAPETQQALKQWTNGFVNLEAAKYGRVPAHDPEIQRRIIEIKDEIEQAKQQMKAAERNKKNITQDYDAKIARLQQEQKKHQQQLQKHMDAQQTFLQDNQQQAAYTRTIDKLNKALAAMQTDITAELQAIPSQPSSDVERIKAMFRRAAPVCRTGQNRSNDSQTGHGKSKVTNR